MHNKKYHCTNLCNLHTRQNDDAFPRHSSILILFLYVYLCFCIDLFVCLSAAMLLFVFFCHLFIHVFMFLTAMRATNMLQEQVEMILV